MSIQIKTLLIWIDSLFYILLDGSIAIAAILDIINITKKAFTISIYNSRENKLWT